jgi:mxaC protein
MNTTLAFDQALWLLLLPLALLPLRAPTGRALRSAWAATAPRDAASRALQLALRSAAVLALAATVLALAGPYRPEDPVERVGRGAEIVLVLDRSRSMDERFAGARSGPAPKGTGPEALDYYMRLRHSPGESKGKVARQMLAEFAARRPEDRFGMIVFSTLPMPVLAFTQKPEVIQAAIAAGNIGRGLSETDIGLALLSALSYFEHRAYTGSRIILLVSDGGDRIDPDARERIAQLAKKARVSIYWIYIRTATSPGLMQGADEPPSNADTVPEYFLHRFFQSLAVPYRAYEAENPEALRSAIDEVSRLENLPITYLDTLPRRDLAPWCHGLALLAVALLLAASATEIRTWHA